MEAVQENEFAIAGIDGDATDPGTTRRSFCRGGALSKVKIRKAMANYEKEPYKA